MSLRRSFREWVRDVFVTACALVIGLLVLAGARDTYEAVSGWEDVKEAVLGGISMLVLLLFRRSRPMHTALFLTVWGLTSSVAWGATAMAVFGVAVHRPWRSALAVAGLNCGLILSAFLGLPADLTTRERLESVAVFVLGYALLVATGLLIRSRRQLVESLRERARQAEEGQRLRIEEARHLERERIAREMHDVLAHRISLLAVHAGALEFRPDTPEEHREAVGIIRRSAYEAMEDLREVIWVLRAPGAGEDPQRPQPTLADVPELVREARAAGTRIELDDRVPDPAAVPDRVGRHAYRIVQEGLTNARKHAPDAAVRVVLDAGPELTIELDNATAPGREPALPGAGAGLVGLAERVALLGGTLEHGAAGGRFRLRARLPL
ncbi:sensor histidine kinase [Actinomadura sp. WAC 06369]|uniref:sensor histidine kinase n=1 Tax=Actinomadura sp. WAC 06369 TaxID=2203193 RepID=UPI000F775FE2|nr:histidine kinase [Actinomadura sp. WAC 06369]RSN70824.1 histidine kinase [Actinomadura sp. WAC 06369]